MDLYTHDRDIPIPRPIKQEGAHAQSLGNSSNIQDSPPFHPSNGSLPLPPLSTSNTEHQSIIPYTSKKKRGFRYLECLKNHAAARGRHATDGCGEFMPSGEEGSLEALNCSACGCHRNFHRREMEGEEAAAATYECYHHHLKRRNVASHKGVLIAAGHGHITRAPPHPMVMPLVAMQADDMQGVGGGLMARPPIVNKRFRTKFTPDQKEKMLAFAEKLGWRLHKEEEGIVQQFCQEVGVRRKVLKVWMHNNKHILAKDKPHPQLE